jgi:ATP-dependent DNA helicase RecQ
MRSAPGGDEKAVLRGLLHSLPERFGIPKSEFFQPAGRSTYSGVIFTPTVNGISHGVTATATEARKATEAEVTVYSGKAPTGLSSGNWEALKRENVSAFKGNKVPLLVATKAFGMGIDKPNIRYTVHHGMPSSLESFYQEAGRAGRDRKPALCTVLFSEFDPGRSDLLLDPSADLEELKKLYDEASKKTSLRDDITRALFFHLESFNGISADVENVRRVLESIGDLARATQIEIPFWSAEDRKDQEKAIFRLTKIAVLSDYEVAFGSAKFLLHVNQFDFERSTAALLDYASASQPTRAKSFAKELSEIREGSPKEFAFALASKLINFTYDIVERARRRSIQEAILLARTATSDDDIRRRLIDYLQEGFGAERLDALLEGPDVDFSQWAELIEKVLTPVDAGELRGLTIRALESYPDHPGLLLIRGLVEAMCSDMNEGVCSQTLQASLRSAVTGYDVSTAEVQWTINYLADTASAKVPTLRTPLIYTLLRLTQDGVLPTNVNEQARALARSFDSSDVDAVISAFDVSELSNLLCSAADRALGRWSSSTIRTTLGV